MNEGHVYRTTLEAIADGSIKRLWPEHAVAGRHAPEVGYLAARPLKIGGPGGVRRQLDAGDLLTPSEALHAGGALAAMRGRGDLVELPTSCGVLFDLQELRDEVDRLELVVAVLTMRDPELKRLAEASGLFGFHSVAAAV